MTSLLREVLTAQELSDLGLNDAVRSANDHPEKYLSLREFYRLRFALTLIGFLRLFLLALAAYAYKNSWFSLPSVWSLGGDDHIYLVYAALAPLLPLGLEGRLRPRTPIACPWTLEAAFTSYLTEVAALLDLHFLASLLLQQRRLLAWAAAFSLTAFLFLPKLVLGWLVWDSLYAAEASAFLEKRFFCNVNRRESAAASRARQGQSGLWSLLSFCLPPRPQTKWEPRMSLPTQRRTAVRFALTSWRFSLFYSLLRLRVFVQRLNRITLLIRRLVPAALQRSCPSAAAGNGANNVTDSTDQVEITTTQVEMASPTQHLLEPCPPSGAKEFAKEFAKECASKLSERFSGASSAASQSPAVELSTTTHQPPHSRSVQEDYSYTSVTQTENAPPTSSNLLSDNLLSDDNNSLPLRRSRGLILNRQGQYDPLRPSATLRLTTPSPRASREPPANNTSATTNSWKIIQLPQDPSDDSLLRSLNLLINTTATSDLKLGCLASFCVATDSYLLHEALREVYIAPDLLEQAEFLFDILLFLYLHLAALSMNLLRFHCLMVQSDGMSTSMILLGLVVSVVHCCNLFFYSAFDQQLLEEILDEND